MFHYQQKVNKIPLKLYKHWREYEFLKKKENISACSDGSYGDNCTKKCSENCFLKTMCNKISGTCGKCKPGWDNEICNESKFNLKIKCWEYIFRMENK